ncbi:succinylglutamate desuccinylase/aspartoacylase family protein (plasmid) [Cytobacillus oceanisediminis]|uniref:succinylglutamate desuccinylase/aspartoacylase family protein n=1 Tax=Cytobacillus oceanisediminis TaxID=665099 RepID=UPI001864F18E|nr:M14 family metallopeptidase [Cytobacillus oceanisediminis]QOK29889.1 succinylglutamate desuccinylase/aspartoacylase family protein [Cytobacillus oceanisediminis]
MKTIGSAVIKRGGKTQGHIHGGTDTDGSAFNIPVLIAAGKEKGPTVWVHGCVHGEEYGGAASIIKFYQDIDPASLKGTFIGVPVVNLPSFKDRNRISPLDGANLNRIFPGNPKGTYSERLAYRLLETIKDTADYVIDLHSGGIGAKVPFYMIVKDDGSEVAEKGMWLAERMGSDVIWRSKGEAGTGGSNSAHIVKAGIPTVTVECGGGNVTEEHEEQFKIAIGGAMKALQMIPGEPSVQKEYTIINNADFIFTGEGGLFVPACDVGDILNKGDLIGSIMNLYGEVTEELHCQADNAYIAAVGHRYWPTEPGQLIAEAITVESRGGGQ